MQFGPPALFTGVNNYLLAESINRLMVSRNEMVGIIAVISH